MFKSQKPVTRARRSKPISVKRKQGKNETKTTTKKSAKIKKPSLEKSIDYLRGRSQTRLKSSWANIIRRYKDISADEADVIDINSQEVIVDRGNIQKDDVHTFGKESDPHYQSSPSEDDDTIWGADLLSEDEVEFIDAEDLKDKSIEHPPKKTKDAKESFAEDADEITLWIDNHLPRIDSDLDIALEDSEIESRVEDENSATSCNDSDSIEIPCDTSSDEQSIPIQDLYDIIMDAKIKSPVSENPQSSCEGGVQENSKDRIIYYDIESGSEGFETCSDYE